MKHYFSTETDLKSEIIDIEYNYKDVSISFKSDNGVFSKKYIDYGSRVLLENISIDNEKTCLDIGCGYGTFGIALAKKYNLNCDLVDVNLRAIELAKNNAIENNVKVNVYQSFVYDEVNKTFDMIVTNPPIRAGKDVVMKIINESIDYLNKKGSIWVIIQKKQGAPSVKKKLEELFGYCEVVKRDKGYYLLRASK